MKIIQLLLLALLMIGCGEESKPKWYKGNLHTHSYWSDGNDYPEQIIKWYKDHGYNFIALSDHNVLTEGEKWIQVKKGTPHEETFRQYLESFGESWVEYEDRDDYYRVRLKTLQEYRSLFEEEDSFLVIKSEEITDGYKNKPIHVNATNIRNLIEPQGGNSVAEVMQNNIDAILNQREATGQVMIPHINHPNFGWTVTAGDLKKLEGEQFFEVYNGHPHVHNYGDSLRSGTERMWDEVNTHYLINGKPIMYGLAVDDAHNYREFGSNQANPGRGWIFVRSQTLDPDSLIAAMERGDFYASTGVRLRDVRFDGRTLNIDIAAEDGVSYTMQFIGVRSDEIEKAGTLLSSVHGTSASYAFSGNELYVRAKIVSDKLKANPYAEGEVEVAWSQPVVPHL